MKTVAVVFVLFVASALAELTEQQKSDLSKFADDCMTEIGIESESIKKMIIGQEPEKNGKFNCYMSCVLKKIGIIQEDGSINVDVVRQEAPADIPKEAIEDLISKCKDTTLNEMKSTIITAGADDCEKAGNLIKCFVENKTFNLFN
ncbi:general odorant-binding protein 56d-like isoform X1 [Hylaeus volcanicus]|uniref:general odorant-binding protein 56d-like isoform X1 n=1 Tax=Hylaeus volcanicus TaxID=313075 RepID=UPI0023B7A8F5|nr:general odorant-binding protein 56d-like isoform X1 [Hylaeus volcanicus]